jgi:HSP90 family molecular chaperone
MNHSVILQIFQFIEFPNNQYKKVRASSDGKISSNTNVLKKNVANKYTTFYRKFNLFLFY